VWIERSVAGGAEGMGAGKDDRVDQEGRTEGALERLSGVRGRRG
jgi:hypothetical protein